MTKEERLKNRQKENLERLKNFCLMDDDFMTVCFENNIKGVELVLRIILEEPDLIVTEVKTQYFMKNLQKRSLRLDIFATNSNGKKFNIEIQRKDEGAGFKRARYHSSLIDAKVLNPGEDFGNLPETYVIFITENDIFKKGLPMYHIERCVAETGAIFGDEAHIIYVNGKYRGDTPLGHLMEDFHCTNPADVYYNELKGSMRYFKETKEGTEKMSRIMEEAIAKERAEAREEAKAESLLQSVERIMKSFSVDLAEACRVLGVSFEEYEKAKEICE